MINLFRSVCMGLPHSNQRFALSISEFAHIFVWGGAEWKYTKSFPSVGLHVWFWQRLGDFCQLSGTNRCQHLFRYRLGNSLVAVLTGPSPSHPFASPPASLSLTSACCLLGLKMWVSRIKSSEKKNPLRCTYLYLCPNLLLDNCYIWSCFWNSLCVIALAKCPGSAKMSQEVLWILCYHKQLFCSPRCLSHWFCSFISESVSLG